MIRFLRTDLDASEVLTVVRFDRSAPKHLAGTLAIQITSGPEVGDDFVGLYTLDGDRIDTGNYSWSIVTRLSLAKIETIRSDWETGTSSVEALT